MCGIVGYYGDRADEIDLSPAAKAILHRGPDDQGIQCGTNWKVAFNRLSIIDTSENGMQPFSFGGVTVYVNGEIYNYRELKAAHANEFTCRSGSDVEIIPFLYRKYGLDFLQKINGMFAMVLIDEQAGVTYLIRDRYGKKPLFYTVTSRGIFFASELKAIQAIVALEPDKTNIALNFVCWFLIQPLTLYKNVFNVNPGSYLELQSQHHSREIRWYNPHIKVSPQGFDEVRERFLFLYKRSIELRLRSDVPVGVFLSGGLDSTSQAYIANQLSTKSITAFTANIENKDLFEGNNTDISIPRRLCNEMGWQMVDTPLNFQFFDKHIMRFVEDYEGIFVDSGLLVFYALAQSARRKGVKVVFTGVGGDELFGGYPWQSQIRWFPKPIIKRSLQRPTSRYAYQMLKLLYKGGNKYTRKMASIYQLLDQARIWHAQSLSGAFQTWMGDVNENVFERIDQYSPFVFQNAMSSVDDDLYNQCQWANIFTVIGYQNYMVDKACMFSSVENRSPSLDFEVFEYMMSVPDQMKIQKGPKGLLRKILSDFMPSYVVEARKSGPTMPLHLWFNDDDLRKHVDLFVTRKINLISEFVSSDLAKAIKSNPDVLYSGRALPLFAVVSYLMWAKRHIEQSIPDSSISFTEMVKTG
jgi:asparagine synthase (glutamine-hydrolysing)